MKFVISHTDDILTSHAGLALVGALLVETGLRKRLNAVGPDRRRGTTSHADVLFSMIGLMCLGKNDYAAIEPYRKEPFFAKALGLRRVPSEETLRQRLDELGETPIATLSEENALMVRRRAAGFSLVLDQYVPLDIDVTPLDNSGTKKEGVAWTYKKHDGYAPIMAYLGQEGYLIDCELRPGDQHCQSGAPEFLDRAIKLARKATDAKLLVRMDAGNDDAENMRRLLKGKVEFVIKRNLRRESLDDWLETAEALGKWEEPRPGKEVFTGDTHLEREGKLYRVVFRVVKRTVDKTGQRLLLPDLDVSTWWTSLGPRKATPEQVIELYHQHGTSEQFHSELKSDMDLERLPSGKFATNALILALGQIAYNVLRLCGQNALAMNDGLPPEKQAPISKPVARRRLRSVIQDLMRFAARVTRHARRLGLALWRGDPWRIIWEQVYHCFTTPKRPAPS